MSLYWLNRMDTASPYEGTVKESGFVDTAGELLVVKEEYSSVGTVYVLTVRLDTERLENLSEPYRKLGYDVTVLSNGKVLMETNPALTKAYRASLEGGGVKSGTYASTGGKTFV